MTELPGLGPGTAIRLLALALSLASAPSHAAPGWMERLFGSGPTVRVERTTGGLVHVTAPDEFALGYGIGYAQAQDRGCAIAERVVTAAGERSRWFGADSGVRLGGRTLDNRTSDLFLRSHLDDVALERAWRAASPAAQDLLQGLVEGFDRWRAEVEDRPESAPCGRQEWLRAISVVDARRLVELESDADGEIAWADAIALAQPPGADPLREPPARPPLAQGPGAREAASRPGGMTLAFGRAETGGAGLLLAAPDAPWTGADRPWAAHLVIPGKLDALGAMPGPVPQLTTGFNRRLAWGTARSPSRSFVLRRLLLSRDDPTAYLVDGRPERMTPVGVRTVERVADGLEPLLRTLYRTRYGPVVVAPALGLGWDRSVAYALEDVGALDARGVDTWLAVARADSVDALHDALHDAGTGTLALVAADAQGRVAFADAGPVPDVDVALDRACRVAGPTGDLWLQHGLAMLDGSRTACALPQAAGQARAGRVPAARTPWLAREDWVQASGNNAAWAQPAVPYAAFTAAPAERSRLHGGDPAALPLRTRAVLAAVAARLAAAPASGPSITAASLDALGRDTHDEAARAVKDELRTLCPMASTEATRTGCATLARWDGTDDAGSRGAALFREWWREVSALPGLWRVPFSADDPLHTPRGLATPWQGGGRGGASRRQELMDALGQAVHTLRRAGGRADSPLGDLQFADVGGTRVPLSGGEPAQGTVLALTGRNAASISREGYAPSEGPGWWQRVGFDEQGVHAVGVLPGGQADDAPPEVRLAAWRAFAAGTPPPVPFTAAEVEAARVGSPLEFRAPKPSR